MDKEEIPSSLLPLTTCDRWGPGPELESRRAGSMPHQLQPSGQRTLHPAWAHNRDDPGGRFAGPEGVSVEELAPPPVCLCGDMDKGEMTPPPHTHTPCPLPPTAGRETDPEVITVGEQHLTWAAQ